MFWYVPCFSPTYPKIGLVLFLVAFWSISSLANNPQYDISMRAWLGDPKAQTQLGERFQMGTGVSQDDLRAIHWFQNAARQGYVDAQVALARMYEQRQSSIPPNLERAAFWYSKAAERGSDFAKARLTVLRKEHPLANYLDQAWQYPKVMSPPLASDFPAKARQTTVLQHPWQEFREGWGTPDTSFSFSPQPNPTTNSRFQTQNFSANRTLQQDSYSTPTTGVINSNYHLNNSINTKPIETAALAASISKDPSFFEKHGLTMLITLGIPFLLWFGLTLKR